MAFGQYAAATGPNPQRFVGLGVVALLHVVVIWGLANGLARQVVELLPAPIETRIIEEREAPQDTPPPPPPVLEAPPPPPFIPPPEISIVQPAPRPAAIAAVTHTPPPPAPPPAPVAAPRVPVRVAPVVRAQHCRDPDYPSISERLGETGTVLLALKVGLDGRVTESRVESSSGHARLDKAAVDGLSRCRFTPGTVDGVPETAWAKIRYTFKSQR